ncbi:MAG: hypothetical protein DWQ36_20190 [Acidobacteria bacterium]|nr:MAG: hypothetical protein DWQ30_10145 [Acidobacteriota bacterium]REK03189.1 MAG: hypothetical protein DWQ36_20190 [Acidobacteriota bacterium]
MAKQEKKDTRARRPDVPPQRTQRFEGSEQLSDEDLEMVVGGLSREAALSRYYPLLYPELARRTGGGG